MARRGCIGKNRQKRTREILFISYQGHKPMKITWSQDELTLFEGRPRPFETEAIPLNDATWYPAPTVHVSTCTDHAHQPLLLHSNSRCHSCHYHVHVIMSLGSRQHTCTCTLQHSYPTAISLFVNSHFAFVLLEKMFLKNFILCMDGPKRVQKQGLRWKNTRRKLHYMYICKKYSALIGYM